MKRYLDQNVLEAAQERVKLVFDAFEEVVVSVSGGKDSTVLYHLAIREAESRGRKLGVFFLDQEAEYAASIEVVDQMVRHPAAAPMWYQVPLYLTNATSFEDEFLYAWGPGEAWMRAKHPLAIHTVPEDCPQRFYEFFRWQEARSANTAFLVGLRAEESLNRFRSVAKNAGYQDIKWSTKTDSPSSFRFYPVYDWSLGDVWKFLDDEGLPYNRVYDQMFAANHNYYNTMRVSNLIHEKSFSCLTSLQELEPQTYDALTKRVKGIEVASIYAKEALMFGAKELPTAFPTWLAYRDFLLQTSPTKHKARFEKRFAAQEENEDTARQQCRQLVLNDYENSVPATQGKAKKAKADLAEWWDLL